MKKNRKKESDPEFKLTVIRRGRSPLKAAPREIPSLIKNALLRFALIVLAFLTISLVLCLLEIY